MKKRVTIHQVAKEAGVSPTAVSFAFNNPEQVGESTVRRILEVARQLGYFPNPIARAMISQRTGAIGLLVPMSISACFKSPFIPPFLQGIGSVCDAHSLSIQVISPYEGSLEEATRRAPVDGYIVLGLNEDHEEIEPLRQRQVHFVIVDGDARTVSEINVDDEGGAYSAASYLLRKGHQDILILTFEQPAAIHKNNVFFGVGGRRLAGYRRAYQEFGQQIRLEQLVQAQTSIDGGAAAFRSAWEAGRRPTALLAMSDAFALGAIAEARKLGVQVPADLEVIGFDDIPLSALSQPALSTVHQPIVLKGQRATELLVETLEEVHPPSKIKLDTHLILRDSTRHV